MTAATPARMDAFHQNGYVVIEDLVTSAELQHLSDVLEEVARDVDAHPQVKRSWVQVGADRQVGHIFHQHLHHPLMDELTRKPQILDTVSALMGEPARLYTTQVMLKAPHEEGHVFQPHQDCYYWQFMPPEVITCWFAFDEATPANGCLTVVPGSHQLGLLPHVRYESGLNQDGKQTSLWCVDREITTEMEMVEAPVKAGGAVFFHGLTIHASCGNRTDGWRRATGLIYMPARHESCLNPQQLAIGWRA